jgi:hypothetical protein
MVEHGTRRTDPATNSPPEVHDIGRNVAIDGFPAGVHDIGRNVALAGSRRRRAILTGMFPLAG